MKIYKDNKFKIFKIDGYDTDTRNFLENYFPIDNKSINYFTYPRFIKTVDSTFNFYIKLYIKGAR